MQTEEPKQISEGPKTCEHRKGRGALSHFLFLSLFSLFLSGCVEVVDNPLPLPDTELPTLTGEDEALTDTYRLAQSNPALHSHLQKHSDPRRIVQAMADGNLILVIEENEAIEHYDIVVLQNEAPKALVISKGSESLHFSAQPVIRWTEVHNQQMSLQVQEVSSGGTLATRQFQFALPADWSVSQSIILNENFRKEFRRVWIQAGVVITAQNFSFRLRAHELVLDGVQIQSFPAGLQAGLGKNGRSGGSWQWQARRARGQVDFHLRGENGGDGLPGSAWTERARQGVEGKPAAVYCEAPDGRITRELRAGGQCACLQEPTDGGPGFPGAPGRTGGPGGVGGDTPEFHFLTLDEEQGFRVGMAFAVGRGGKGGAGGAGQLGGAGGAGGRAASRCSNPAKAGPLGVQGPPGSKGADNQEGSIRSSCWQNSAGLVSCQ